MEPARSIPEKQMGKEFTKMGEKWDRDSERMRLIKVKMRGSRRESARSIT